MRSSSLRPAAERPAAARPASRPSPLRRVIATLSGLAVVLAVMLPASVPGLAAAVGTPTAGSAAAASASATLVGDLQSELGCAEDWAPACAATALGGGEADGTWEGTFDVPAGAWEFKIAMDGAWDVSYGVGDQNVPLRLEQPARLTFTLDEATGRIALSSPDLTGATGTAAGDAADAATIADAPRHPGGSEVFYFVLTDRFADGDPANNTGGIEGGRLDHGYDPTHSGFYHGGDLQGLTDRLDYVEGLGATAIWLTPSFTNRPVQGEGADASAGYHGYWVTDFTQIDPHLGGNDALHALVDAAHARGIEVYFDIIVNHTADVIDYAEGRYSYIDSATSPWVATDGTAYDAAALDAVAGSDAFPTFDASGFPYTPVRPEGSPVLVPEWLNDVTLYHNRGDSTWSGESVTYGDFVGLDDLMTEDPRVVDGFTEIYQAWMDFGIDGFRIDTAKHVNFGFWEEWTQRIDAHARTVNPDFFTFGEVYDGDARLLAPYSRDTGMDATLDFAFQGAALNFAKGFTTNALAQLFETDDYYTTPHTSAVDQPTFVGNHDMGRVGHLLAGSGNELARTGLAHDLMFLSRGQPVVYYGDEQGFAGVGNDKSARQSLFASQVPEYTEQRLLTGEVVGAQDRYDTAAPLYQRIAALSALRANHPTLSTGAQIELHATDGPGLYAFARVDAAERVEHIAALNSASSSATAAVATLTPGATYDVLYASDGAAVLDVATLGDVTAGADGTISVTVPAHSALVLRAQAPIPAATDLTAPVLTVGAAPATGPGAGLVPVSATATTGVYAPTSFGVRPLGATDWQRLGTAEDDTPRVFHDVRDVPRGTALEYRAVTHNGAEAADGARMGTSTLVLAGVDLAADDAPDPGTGGDLVTVPGSHNAAMGCAGDWASDCTRAALSLDAASGMYVGDFDLPAGTYEYKVAVGGSWDVNYGAGGTPGGANITYTHAGGPITFVYDPVTHLVTNTAVAPLMTLPGTFNQASGCAEAWDPACLATLMFDADGDGIFTYTTDTIPTGAHEVKVAHGRSWAENYGVDGALDGANYSFTATEGKAFTFMYHPATHELTIEVTDPALPGTGQAQGFWLTPGLLAWPAALPAGAQGGSFELVLAPRGGATLTDGTITGDGAHTVPLTLDPAGLPPVSRELDPYLADHLALRVPEGALTEAQVREALTGQVMLLRRAADGTPAAMTGVQTARVLDSLYAAEARAGQDIGVRFAGGTPTLTLWAPTAKNVDLLLWPGAATSPVTGEPTRTTMARQSDGTWTAVGYPDWKDRAYLYDVEVYVPSLDAVVTNRVTDPSSQALTLNSTHSVLVDLADRAWQPEQWRTTAQPEVARAVDRSIYELHVRDFSITDTTVPEEQRGTYLAFTQEDSAGMRHLSALAAAGLTTIHLLPTFDIATIEEQRALQMEPAIPDDGPAGTGQQAAVTAVADHDAFNWGYDPYHWSTPEGSYATDGHQDGGARVAEFRAMVGALHATGLEVVLDKVYNHTAASGQADRSVLDQIVPGYYHRLSPTGSVETSTCCQNVATEHEMAEQLMVDSVVTWARDYKVDGFRFDLMGHHSRANMLAVRAALDELTEGNSGVDGKGIYLYGEGWDFGEVAQGARFVQATQGNLANTGIGTFSDRLRDAMHGGSPVDGSTYFQQGFGTGAYVTPNGRGYYPNRETERLDALHQADLVRLGLAGNLADYRLTDYTGTVKTGAQFDYRGHPAGYAAQPDEVVTYVDAHDNETLFDLLTIKLPADTTMADRVRMNTLNLATVALAQTPAFWHAGTDLLRSKSLDRDSYNSGDHFNAIDWSGQESNFGVGLPPAEKNEERWEQMSPLLADPALRPLAGDIEASTAMAQDLLRLRYSTPLFRLGSAEAIDAKVTFPGSGTDARPGVIAMRVDDTVGTDADPALDGLLVVFNATAEPITQTVPELAGKNLVLSPVQAEGADEVVRTTTWAADAATVTVPARTVAVLHVLPGTPGGGTDPGDEEEVDPTAPPNVFLTDSFAATGEIEFALPASGDVFTGDWDGDGTHTLGWREGKRFTFASSNAADAELTVMDYGEEGDEVVVGDWDGDGVTTVGVRRGNLFLLSNDWSGGEADEETAYGRAGDEIVVADIDGDGGDTVNVRRGNMYYLKGDFSGGEADVMTAYGRADDVALPGDTDGDGKDSITVRRDSTFFVKHDLSGGPADIEVAFGRATDVPLLGDWTGAGHESIGVHRPAAG